MPMYTTKEGDRLPIMPIATSADLTGATLVEIRWRLKDGTADRVVGTLANLAIASAGPAGSVLNYTFAAGETVRGLYVGEVSVAFGGEPMTVPGLGRFEFRIAPTIPDP